MIEIPFGTGMSLMMACWLLMRVWANRKNGTVDWKQEGKQLIFLINLLVIYRFTFHPFSKVDGKIQPLIFEWATAWPFRMNLIPFVNLLDYESKGDLLINLIGNFAMFIPTGVMVPLIYRKWDNVKQMFLAGFALSLAIEVVQLPFAVRASDVDDLILNTLGCLAGYGLLVLARAKKRK